ncbi:hypothetical protein CRG98_046033 [Punica granatum]|uniref:Uncharacterized protein n=1 Tax=Punica granatum TaxID=22663 RepID=A0A2I0HPB9_PUNGR|nr:hypothetical protein CRG98_046033 [Punica granatum]
MNLDECTDENYYLVEDTLKPSIGSIDIQALSEGAISKTTDHRVLPTGQANRSSRDVTRPEPTDATCSVPNRSLYSRAIAVNGALEILQALVEDGSGDLYKNRKFIVVRDFPVGWDHERQDLP